MLFFLVEMKVLQILVVGAFAWLTVLLGQIAGSESDKVRELDALFNLSKSQIQSGDLNSAAETLMRLLELDPNHVDAYGVLGATFLAQERYTLAEQVLHAAVALSNWTDVTSVGNLAEAVRANKDLDLAEKIAMTGIRLGGDQPDPTGLISYTLGNIFYEKSNFTAAADWFLVAALKQRVNEMAWIRASTMLFPIEHRDYRTAENVLLEALNALPRSPKVNYYMGLVFHSTNRLSQAVTFYDESSKLDPGNADAFAALAVVLHATGSTEQAIVAYVEAVNLKPDDAQLSSNFAKLLAESGHLKEALQILDRVQKVHPDDASIAQTENYIRRFAA